MSQNQEASNSENQSNALFIWDTQSLFASWEDASWEEPNDFHAHFAAAIHISVNKPGRIVVPGGRTYRFRGAVVPPNEKHRQSMRDTYLLVLRIDPDSEDFARIERLVSSGISTFEPENLDKLEEGVRNLLSQEVPSAEEAELLAKMVLDMVGKEEATRKRELDSRVVKAIKHLREHPDLTEDISLSHIAKVVELSPDRFRHLFNEHMGISMRRYILHLRIKRTGFFLSKGMNLAQAAHSAGFADSAHFSRTFREMYGHSPSSIFRRPERIQMYYCGRQW